MGKVHRHWTDDTERMRPLASVIVGATVVCPTGRFLAMQAVVMPVVLVMGTQGSAFSAQHSQLRPEGILAMIAPTTSRGLAGVPCQPPCTIPTPGSETTSLPSSLTVALPTSTYRPWW